MLMFRGFRAHPAPDAAQRDGRDAEVGSDLVLRHTGLEHGISSEKSAVSGLRVVRKELPFTLFLLEEQQLHVFNVHLFPTVGRIMHVLQVERRLQQLGVFKRLDAETGSAPGGKGAEARDETPLLAERHHALVAAVGYEVHAEETRRDKSKLDGHVALAEKVTALRNGHVRETRNRRCPVPFGNGRKMLEGSAKALKMYGIDVVGQGTALTHDYQYTASHPVCRAEPRKRNSRLRNRYR